MRAGRLDRSIDILKSGRVRDTAGDWAEGYSLLHGGVPAAVSPAPGSERLSSAETAATAPTVFRIRWRPTLADLNPKDRLRYPAGTGRLFDIRSVVEIGRREGLEIAAVTGAD